jgi:hypothetical protein
MYYFFRFNASNLAITSSKSGSLFEASLPAEGNPVSPVGVDGKLNDALESEGKGGNAGGTPVLAEGGAGKDGGDGNKGAAGPSVAVGVLIEGNGGKDSPPPVLLALLLMLVWTGGKTGKFSSAVDRGYNSNKNMFNQYCRVR